jgi:hypothetical protein
MPTYTREQLYNGTTSSVDLSDPSGYTFTLENNSTSQVYFTIESLTNSPIFDSIYFENVVGTNKPIHFISESQHVSFILPSDKTVDFDLYLGGTTVPKEEIRFLATNGHVFSTLDPTSSGSFIGVNLDIAGA